MSKEEVVQEVLTNPQVAAVTAGTGLATGFATVMAWLPPVIGLLGSMLAAGLTAVLIWSHIQKTRAEIRRSESERRLNELKCRQIMND